MMLLSGCWMAAHRGVGECRELDLELGIGTGGLLFGTTYEYFLLQKADKIF